MIDPEGCLESIEGALERVECHLAARARKRRHVPADPAAAALVDRLKAELRPWVDARVDEALQRRAGTDAGDSKTSAPHLSIPATSAPAPLDLKKRDTVSSQHGPTADTLPPPQLAARSPGPIESIGPSKPSQHPASPGPSLLLRSSPLHIRRPSAEALGAAGQPLRGARPLPVPLPLPPR